MSSTCSKAKSWVLMATQRQHTAQIRSSQAAWKTSPEPPMELVAVMARRALRCRLRRGTDTSVQLRFAKEGAEHRSRSMKASMFSR